MLGLYSSVNLKTPNINLIFIVFSLAIILAGCLIEQDTTIDNIANSLLTTFAFLIIWIYNQPTLLNSSEWNLFLDIEMVIAMVAILIFVGQLIRSFLLSLKNLKTHKEQKIDSIASVFGEKKTKIATILSSLVASFGIIFIVGVYLKNLNIFHILIYFAFIPQIFLSFKLKKAKTSKDYALIVKVLDIILFIGILAIPTMSIFLRNALE